MEITGLLSRIAEAGLRIDFGRKGFATRGKEQEGRISYEDGIARALTAFKETTATADPQTMTLAEYTFLTQELHFCDPFDTYSLNSLKQAIQNFDDGFLVLTIVEDSTLYQAVEKAFSHHKSCRVFGDYPKDAFHVACESHKARLKNILRSPGIDHIEKELLKQRLANLPIAQKAYVEKQKKALAN